MGSNRDVANDGMSCTLQVSTYASRQHFSLAQGVKQHVLTLQDSSLCTSYLFDTARLFLVKLATESNHCTSCVDQA